MTVDNRQSNDYLCLKYRDQVLAYPSPDGFPIPMYVDDLLERESVESFLWADYEQHGIGTTLSGWRFLMEVFGINFLINFYIERGYTEKEAMDVISESLSKLEAEAVHGRREAEILQKFGTLSLGHYNKSSQIKISTKEMLCYDIFKPFLFAYFQNEATLTKVGYEFFETLHYSTYLSGYYWFALHDRLKKFSTRAEVQKWIEEQKEKAT